MNFHKNILDYLIGNYILEENMVYQEGISPKENFA